MEKTAILFDANIKSEIKPRTMCNMISAGRAMEGLRTDWLKQLEMLQNNCHFNYIRFHGLLSDDMGVVIEKNGRIYYNFHFIDELFDRLLALGIRPFVELAFMPSLLASGKKTQFWYRANVTVPKDFRLWEDLISHLVRHLVDRYGLEEVEKWYFEVWNEANLDAFWAGTRSDYFRLYEASARAVKSVSEKLRVGGPATSNFVPDDRFKGEREDLAKQATLKCEDIDSLFWKPVWIEEFLYFVKKENLPLDFVSVHPYPTDFALDDGSGTTKGRTRKKESLLDDIDTLHSIMCKHGFENLPIHFTEWNSSPSSRDYAHDYLQEAGYVAWAAINVSGKVDSLSYWTFTDIFEEEGPAPEAFHGGFGLITIDSVPKPAFNAMRMASRLGEEILGRSGEAILTRRKDGMLAALFVNWPEKMTKVPSMSPYPDYTKAEREEIDGENREVATRIAGVGKDRLFAIEILDREHGNATRLWEQLGHSENLSREEKSLLQAEAGSTIRYIVRSDEEGVLTIEAVLEPWAVMSIFELGLPSPDSFDV